MRAALTPGQAMLAILYMFTALLCLRTGWQERRKTTAPQYPWVWLTLALLLLLLGVQEATGILEQITQFFRVEAKLEGWYRSRRAFQLEAVRLVLFLSVAAFAGLIFLIRKAWRRYLPSLCALAFLAGFAAIQGISLHHIDWLMRTAHAGLQLKTWCALTGIVLALFSVFWVENPLFQPFRDPPLPYENAEDEA